MFVCIILMFILEMEQKQKSLHIKLFLNSKNLFRMDYIRKLIKQLKVLNKQVFLIFM